MIKYIKGDLLDAFDSGDVKIIAHGCNCVGGFGSGIAGQIAERFPLARVRYKELHGSGGTELGFFQTNHIEGKGYIINCGTQRECLPRGQKHVDYDSVRKVMQLLLSFSKNLGITPAIPKIGCGLAGGEWDVVEKIVNDIFKDSEIFVYILDNDNE